MYNINYLDHFMVCDRGNHLMEPNESEDFIDPSIKELKLTNIGFTGSRYPYNPKYIPSLTKKWCLKSVLNN